MRLTVVPVQPTASATVTRARASVVVTVPLAAASAELLTSTATYDIASASVTATFPVSEVDYILLSTTPQLDTSGRYQYKSHAVVMTERIVFEYIKTFGDDVLAPELVSLEPQLRKVDSFGLAESFIKTLIFIRRFTDTPTAVDKLLYAMDKALADSVITPEVLEKSLVRHAYSTMTTADGATTHPHLRKFDYQSLLDSAKRQFSKKRTDSFSFTDRPHKGFERPLFDSYAPVDQITVIYLKLLYDGFGLNDAESMDNVFVLNTKGVSNVVFTGDVLNTSTLKANADTVPMLSSGSLRAQNYCDFSYFAEDYVGESRVF
jgi:hypothetical protein